MNGVLIAPDKIWTWSISITEYPSWIAFYKAKVLWLTYYLPMTGKKLDS